MSFEEIFNDLEQQAAQTAKINDGDYIKDGILYCGKCNTAKQAVVHLFGKIHTPFCICECEKQRIEAEKKAHRIERFRSECFGDSNYRNCTFAADDRSNEKLTNAMQAYVDNFPELRKTGQGLLLYGDVGRGKTYAAAEVANALVDMGYSVYFTNFARIANEGTYDDRQDYIDSLNRYALLILDDLAAERKTEYMQEIVKSVIDSRLQSGKPMIVTTNLTSAELKNPQDITAKRIYDRIMEKCLPIEVAGKNRRHETTKNKFSELNKILGL